MLFGDKFLPLSDKAVVIILSDFLACLIVTAIDFDAGVSLLSPLFCKATKGFASGK